MYGNVWLSASSKSECSWWMMVIIIIIVIIVIIHLASLRVMMNGDDHPSVMHFADFELWANVFWRSGIEVSEKKTILQMLKVLLHGQIGLSRTQHNRLLLAVIQTELFKIAMSFPMPLNLHGKWHKHLTFLQSLLSLCMTQDVTRNLFRSNAGLLRWNGWNVTDDNSKIPLCNGSFHVTCIICKTGVMCAQLVLGWKLRVESIQVLRSPTSSTLQWKKWAPAVCMVMALTNCPAPERDRIFRWKLRRQTKKLRFI